MDSAGPNVFAIARDELRAMILEHAGSARACAAEIKVELERLPADHDQAVAPEHRRSAVFKGALVSLELAAVEAAYLAEHLAPLERYVMSGAELLAFRTRFGKLKVDISRLAFAPEKGRPAAEQAERSQSSLLVKVPRLVLPGGALG